MTLKEIKAILGGDVSTKNTKMPGTSFGLSTDYCNVGSKLRKKEGSVCASCYAARIEAFRPSVRLGWQARAKAVARATRTKKGMEAWVSAMQERLAKLAHTHHRWHDSGDLLNGKHLWMIVRIALNMPEIQFWLPTKEKGIVAKFLKKNSIPPNLTIRLSAPMVDMHVTATGVQTSMVLDKAVEFVEQAGIWVCPARHQGNACQDCRACWDKSVECVAYPKH